MSRMYGVTVHKKLAERPLPRLDDVAEYFFGKILGQKLTDEGVKAPISRSKIAPGSIEAVKTSSFL